MRASNIGARERPCSPSVHAWSETIRDQDVVDLTMVDSIRMVPGHDSIFLVSAESIGDDKVITICKLKEPQSSVICCLIAVGALLFRPVFCWVFASYAVTAL